MNPSSIPPPSSHLDDDDEEAEMDLVSRLLDQDTLALLEQSTFDYDESSMKSPTTSAIASSSSKIKPNTTKKTSTASFNRQNEDDALWKISRNAAHMDPSVKQPNTLFRDWPFAILFLLCFFSIIFLSGIYGIPVMKQIIHPSQSQQGEDSSYVSLSKNTTSILFLTILSSLFSIVTSILLLLLIIQSRKECTILISLSLAISVVSSFLLAICFLVLFQNLLGAILSLLCSIVSLWYAMSIRSRIHYAATSLSVALEAIHHSNHTSSFISLALQMTVYFLLWVGLWILTCIGWMYHHESQNHNNKEENVKSIVPVYSIFFLLLSLYWTQQVFTHIVTVTVAGVVGMWWFEPHPNTVPSSSTRNKCFQYTCPSTTIQEAWIRSMTYSLGSICFGSLITSTIQVVRVLVDNARNDNQNTTTSTQQENHRTNTKAATALLFCVLECLLSILGDVVQYMNRWAYIYIGLYGYTYIQSGKKVYSLFTSRGWTFLINDNLIGHTLSLIGFIVALISGIFGALVDSLSTDGLFLNVGEGSTYLSFSICFIIGWLMSRVFMGMVESAVDTVVVCFAEAPEDFEINHPDHCTKMKSAWRQVFGLVY